MIRAVVCRREKVLLRVIIPIRTAGVSDIPGRRTTVPQRRLEIIELLLGTVVYAGRRVSAVGKVVIQRQIGGVILIARRRVSLQQLDDGRDIGAQRRKGHEKRQTHSHHFGGHFMLFEIPARLARTETRSRRCVFRIHKIRSLLKISALKHLLKFTSTKLVDRQNIPVHLSRL